MYESNTNDVTSALQNAQPSIFSADTINTILALTTSSNSTVRFDNASPDVNGNVTVAAGAEVVFVASSDTQQTTVHAPVNAPVVIFQGRGGVIATINDGATTVSAHAAGVVDRVVVGTAGNDSITVGDSKNTHVILGTGNSTVQAGSGHDTVEAGLGNSTIVGGTGGHTVVQLSGNASNYQVTVNNGHAVVTNSGTGLATDITKLQYVQLDSGHSLVFASNTQDAAVASLYHTTFGRDAESGGLDYWFNAVHNGATLKQIATGFANSAEFAGSEGTLNNNDFVQSLYQHTFGRAGEAAGVTYWVDALAHGATKADLLVQFAQIAGNNIAGEVHTEATVVGSVTVVQGII